MQTKVELFQKHQYISIETFRKTGEGVRTPVWFAQDGSKLYVWTDGTSGKAKRIRRNSQVAVAPSDQAGKPLAEYVKAQAELASPGSPIYERGNQMMNKKYGLLKKMFEIMGRSRRADRVVIQINLEV